jgi:ribosomal protein S18 acetylase RimI-like enzyme
VLDQLPRIEAHARRIAARVAQVQVVPVGPFEALFHPSDEPWLSYAVPIGPLGAPETLAGPIAELTRTFRGRGRPVRLEFCAGLWHTLPAALEAAGLVPEAELPLLGCAPATFRPRAPRDARVKWVAADDDLAFLGSLMKRGFETPGRIEPEEIERLRDALGAGTRYAMAELVGLPAASGCSSPDAGTTEIAAVSTLPTMRRRGAASALASFLVAEHFAAGGDLAWLTCGDAAAYALFQSLGFDDLGLRVSFAEPSTDPAAPPD